MTLISVFRDISDVEVGEKSYVTLSEIRLRLSWCISGHI